MKRAGFVTEWPWKANTTSPCHAQYVVMHYANHKVYGHKYGLAWKPAIAAMPLATSRNAISEATNVLYECDNKVRDADIARA